MFANAALARARGMSVETVLQTNYWELMKQEGLENLRSSLLHLSRHQPGMSIEGQVEKLGGRRWTLWKYYALRFDSDGRWLEAASLGVDMTQQRRIGDELRLARERAMSSDGHLMQFTSLELATHCCSMLQARRAADDAGLEASRLNG